MGDALQLITSRRSIREYTDEPVTPDQVRAMLEAAMAAPSGRNLQAWEFVVVTDVGTRHQLAGCHRSSGMVASAPVVFVVCGRVNDPPHWVSDCSAAVENLLLEATSLGLGGVWVGLYPMPEREAYVRRVLGIPNELRTLCMVPVGHPAEAKPPHTKFDLARIHYGAYDRHEPED
jgi:nitroreductase